MIASFHEQIFEAERLTDELRQLVKQECLYAHADIHQQAKRLVGWAESYRRGLRYGLADGRTGHGDDAWMTGVSDRYKLEAEQLDSLDDRGTPAAEKSAHHETGSFIDSAKQMAGLVDPERPRQLRAKNHS